MSATQSPEPNTTHSANNKPPPIINRAEMRRNDKLSNSIATISFLFVWIIIWIYSVTRQNAQSSQATNQLKTQSELNDLVWSKELGNWVLSNSQQVEGDSREISAHPDIESCVWPDQKSNQHCPKTDRIINQLKLTHYEPDRVFRISVAGDLSQPSGQELFTRENCPINRCEITNEPSQADVIVFPNADVHFELPDSIRAKQIWIAYLLESPPNTFDKRFSRSYRGFHTFNWTASYRSDSDIVTPYAKFVPYSSSLGPAIGDADTIYAQASERSRALIRNKQTKVAWFVSNCHARNNRLEFARQLAQFIPVDIFGKCGNLTCHKWDKARCLREINHDYKFYLAFENSNNREYITEKLYENSLGYNDKDHLLVPIVMGPPPEDYRKLTPPNSFIHVNDYKTVEDLAKYLHYLGDHDALYYSYLQWKSQGRFVDTKFMCRVCAMAHKSHRDQTSRSISNIKDWWLAGG